jgi:hypothetical protein
MEKPALTYLRYNAKLDENPLNLVGLSDLTPKLDSLRKMEVGKNVPDLIKIGEKFAAACEHDIEGHIPSAFDLPML